MATSHHITLCVVLYLQSLWYTTEALGGRDVSLVSFGRDGFVVAFSNINDKKPFCTGVLIGPRYVLTAQNCLDNKIPLKTVVYLGDSVLDAANPYRVMDWISYPSSQSRGNDEAVNLENHDIAIARLDTDVKSKWLNKQSFSWNLKHPKDFWITAWGFAASQQFKFKAAVKLLDPEICQKLTSWRAVEHGRYFCTSAGKLGVAVNQEDYGSPVLTKASDGTSRIVGITVNALPSNDPRYPLIIIHADVTHYKRFLKAL